MRSLLIVTILAACGSTSAPPRAPAAAGQPLDRATSMLCASPKRAEADLEFASADPAVKASVLARHLKDGVKNPRVLAVIDGWKVEGKTAEQKVAELDSLTHDALLSSKCQLREVLAR